MKRLWMIICLLAVMTGLTFFMSYPPVAEPSIYKTVYVEVVSERGIASGSGFFVSEDGNIMTAYHVVEDADFIMVETTGHEKFLAKVLKTDPTRDCALIDVDGRGYDYFSLEDNRTAGLPVYAIGAPLGHNYFPYITEGIISNPSVSLFPEYLANLIMVDAATNPGNSGGPIVNKATGNVVGMLVAGDGRGEGLNFAIPSFVLIEFLQECYAGR